MNKAQIKAKKRRKEERDRRKLSRWWLNLGDRKPVPSLDEYFAKCKCGGGPHA